MLGTLSERDIMQLILDQHKHTAKFLTDCVIECSTPALRHECQQALNNTLNHQYQIWEAMHQRGWYQSQPASPQEIAMAQRSLTTQLAQTGGMTGQVAGQNLGMTGYGIGQTGGMIGQVPGQTGGLGGASF